jgi:hypothetical protein
MFTTHVALVPYDEGLVPVEELLYVASALQTQVTRDLGPLWDLSGSVSPFLRLEDVPPVYVPLVVVAGLDQPWHGFHITSEGRPLALVGYRTGWSLLASHELMEMLCDPSGTRTQPGRSLKDDQGHVEYLVEVCDPCQDEHYMIHDVHVSDFVTPEYYGPHDAHGGRYSFTGSVNRPLGVCEGGLLTWYAPNGEIWQQSGNVQPPQQLKVNTLSRASLSPDTTGGASITANLPKLSRSKKGYYRLGPPLRRYGSGLKTSIDQILEQVGAKTPRARIADIVRLLEELANDGSPTRAEFEANPVKTLKKFNLDPPAKVKKLVPLEPAETYRVVLAALQGGEGLGDPRLAAWLSTHAALHPAGIW